MDHGVDIGPPGPCYASQARFVAPPSNRPGVPTYQSWRLLQFLILTSRLVRQIPRLVLFKRRRVQV